MLRYTGFNYLLLPKDRDDAQIVDELKPMDDEIRKRPVRRTYRAYGL